MMDDNNIKDKELEQVTGGTCGDIDIRKDLYENIILSTNEGNKAVSAHDHNVMLTENDQNKSVGAIDHNVM